MKIIGLLGGTGWSSTIEYYTLINQLMSARLGGNHSAKILLKSIDYHMLPIISNWLKPDPEMSAYIKQMRSTKYTKDIVESRRKDAFYNPKRLGKTYEEILSEKSL